MPDGGNSTEPDSFSTDEFKESDHPRDNDGKFSSNGNSPAGKNSVKKSVNYDRIKNRQRKPIHLSKEEYAKVIHELNTNLTSEQRKKKIIKKYIGNHLYTFKNDGFNEYKPINKKEI